MNNFTVLHEGDGTYLPGGLNTNKTMTIKILKNQNDYVTQLAYYSSDTPVVINFSENQVLLADMGEKSSLGYSIEVSSIEENEDSVIVHVLSILPGSNCAVDTAISNPYQFVLVPTNKPLVIQEEQMEHCNNPV